MNGYVYVIFFNHTGACVHTPKALLIDVCYDRNLAYQIRKEWIKEHKEDWAYPEDVIIKRMKIRR